LNVEGHGFAPLAAVSPTLGDWVDTHPPGIDRHKLGEGDRWRFYSFANCISKSLDLDIQYLSQIVYTIKRKVSMPENNAEIQTQAAWGGENTRGVRSTDPAGETRARGFGEIARDLSQRIAGETRSRSIPGSTISISGGILTQLIQDAESQLEKTRATIEWYQSEEQEQLQRLESLQRLRELEQDSQESSD
jgi:hypothetical protein